MKKLSSVLLFLVFRTCIMCAQSAKPANLYVAGDSLHTSFTAKPQTDSITCRSIMLTDTVGNKCGSEINLNHIFRPHRYDTFKEKIKEPWLGDALRNILNR